MFMHIGGVGDEAKLAAAVGRVFAKMTETAGGKGEAPRAEIDPARTTLDPGRSRRSSGRRARSPPGSSGS